MPSTSFGSFTKSRIEAFSDGLFAIIVTLLVFDLKLPVGELATNEDFLKALWTILPKMLSWINSFLIVCVIWMNHHRLMDMFDGIDAGIFWLNNLLLMFVSLIPFPTTILGERFHIPAAVSFYGLCLAMAAFGFTALRYYVAGHPYLLKKEVNPEVFKKGTVLSLVYGPGLYLAGAAVAWIHPALAFAIYFFIPVYFIFPKATQTN